MKRDIVMTNIDHGRAFLVALFALSITASPACAQGKLKFSGPEAATPALAHYEIKASDLPPPKIEDDVNNSPQVIPRPKGAKLTLPPGFEISTFAEGNFERPRWMALAPNGDVLLADADAEKIIVLRDKNGDGVAEERFTFAEGLNKPFGMAFWHDYFYVGNTNGIVRFHYKSGQTKADGPPEKIADLPGKGDREHWTRNI